MFEWNYIPESYGYVCFSGGYYAEVYETEEFGWVYVLWLSGRPLAQESYYCSPDCAMTDASTAIQDDLRDSIFILESCGV